MRRRILWVALLMTASMLALSARADQPTVDTAEEAIAIAKKACAAAIPKDGGRVNWSAREDSGAWVSWNGEGSGWRVDGWYDNSHYDKARHTSVYSLIDINVFVPKKGKPYGCNALPI